MDGISNAWACSHRGLGTSLTYEILTHNAICICALLHTSSSYLALRAPGQTRPISHILPLSLLGQTPPRERRNTETVAPYRNNVLYLQYLPCPLQKHLTVHFFCSIAIAPTYIVPGHRPTASNFFSFSSTLPRLPIPRLLLLHFLFLFFFSFLCLPISSAPPDRPF
jgi:hypothetical protein